MDISSPSTPPGLDDMPELSPPRSKFEVIVILSDSDSEGEEPWRRQNLATDQQPPPPQQQHNPPHNTPNLTPARYNQNNNSSPHEPMARRTYAARASKAMNDYTVLDHATTSPPTPPNEPITVLLVLTPHPASLKEQAAFEEFSARFSADFSDFASEEMWTCVSLYKCLREQAQLFKECTRLKEIQAWVDRMVTDQDKSPLAGLNVSGDGPDGPCKTPNVAGEATMHRSALVAKMEQEIEVGWRFFIPALKTCIQREVQNGSKLLVVGGLSMGDIDGIRAFAQKVSPQQTDASGPHTNPEDADPRKQIAEPAGIIAIQPGDVPSAINSAVVPAEFKSRSVVVSALSIHISSSFTK
jgi:hypothetical protein